MNKSYRLVIFDWEGTLADTLGSILHTVAIEAQKLGYGEVNLYEARKYVHLGLAQALKKIFPHLSMHQQEHLLEAVNHAIISKTQEVCLIPGAFELVRRIHDAPIDMAIATNKVQHSLHKALHATGMDAFFKVTRSAGQTPPKPCPQMLEEIMDEFGVDVSQTLMIGDSVVDIEMATSIQMDVLAVDFYQQNQEELKDAGCLALFDDYALLADFLHLPKK